LLVEVEGPVLPEPHQLVDHPVGLLQARQDACRVLAHAAVPVGPGRSLDVACQQGSEHADGAVLARALMEDGGGGAADDGQALALRELLLDVEQLTAAALALQPGVVQAFQDAEHDERGGAGGHPSRRPRPIQADQEDVDHEHLRPARGAASRPPPRRGPMRPGIGRTASHTATAPSVTSTTINSDGSRWRWCSAATTVIRTACVLTFT